MLGFGTPHIVNDMVGLSVSLKVYSFSGFSSQKSGPPVNEI